MNEVISNAQTKRQCRAESCKKAFSVIAKEKQFYEQKKLPLPDFCPGCRHKLRMALRSERQLYRRTCGKCSSSILSTYPDSAPYVIYCQPCFWKEIG